MLLVTFDKVPKGAKKYFQFKHKLSRKSPELDIKTADNAVKEYAKSLKESGTNVAFTIFDDEDEEREESSFEALILPEDKDGGILDLIDRDLENENLTREQEEIVTDLKDQIFNELEPSLSEEDNLNEDNGFMFDSTQVLLEDAEAELKEESIPQAENEDKKSNEDDFRNNSAVNSSENPSVNTLPVQLTDLQNPDQTIETTQSEVITYGKYTDANDIIDRLPRGYDKNQFALTNIRHDLGYADHPRDQYEKALNEKIDQILRDYSMQDIQRLYDEGLAKSKAAIVDRLKEAYNQVNKETLDKIVETKTTTQVSQLTIKANQKKQNNNADLSKLKETKALELKTHDEEALIEYKNQLEEKRKLALKNFNEQEEIKTRNANDQIEEQLKADIVKVKQLARNEEVQKRNSELDDNRTTISNNFDHAVRENYDKNNNQFEEKLKKVQVGVQLAKAEIAKQKQLDQEKAEEKRQREAEAARKERELDLKQKEIEQNKSLAKLQQENIAKLPEEFAKAIAAAITQNNMENPNVKITLNNGTDSPEGSSVPHIKGEIVDLDKIDDDKEESFVENDNLKEEKPMKKYYKAGLISLFSLAALGGIGAWTYNNNQANTGQKLTVEQASSSVKQSNKSKQEDNRKSSIKFKDKTNNSLKVSQTHTHLTRSQAVLKQYRQSKTWAQKRDMLDGLLGQGDARNLKKIATIYPNSIASLYSAIANEDKAQTRTVWLNMSDVHRTEISNAAKKAVALAFYDIADWQDGWLARYAY